jgi:uncharacterized cofD-like protein
VIEAIEDADYIFIGPGDLYTSIIASLIVPGIREALQNTNGKLIYILNIMTKFGETHHFRAPDFVGKIEDCLERTVDGVICNTSRPSQRLLKKYASEKAELVGVEDVENWMGSRRIYAADLLEASNEIVRHDSKKLAMLIQDIVFKIIPKPT